GAVDQSDRPAYFSNYGSSVGVWAPGVGITSTAYPGNSSYASEDGTSFACPLTSGVAGLVFSLHPTWLPQTVARQIVQTCENVVDPSNRNNYWGRVNATNVVGPPVAGPGLIVTGYELDGVANDTLGVPGLVHTLK